MAKAGNVKAQTLVKEDNVTYLWSGVQVQLSGSPKERVEQASELRPLVEPPRGRGRGYNDALGAVKHPEPHWAAVQELKSHYHNMETW